MKGIYESWTLFKLGVSVLNIDMTPTLMIILNYVMFPIVSVSVSVNGIHEGYFGLMEVKSLYQNL
jgi:ABC-type proline/glycine betaine transport system permease subunit